MRLPPNAQKSMDNHFIINNISTCLRKCRVKKFRKFRGQTLTELTVSGSSHVGKDSLGRQVVGMI